MTTIQATAERLAWYFRRNGYVRRYSVERRKEVGTQVYKKGDEVRLVADTFTDLLEIRRLLRAAGFKPGRAFRKARQYRQPIYGRAEVTRFLELTGSAADS